MQQTQFEEFLKSLNTLSPEQLTCLHNTLPPCPKESESVSQSRLLERLKYYFDQHPRCPHCSCESMTRWGQSAGHQRYRCNQCGRTCNAMSGTPLTHVRIREKLDDYLACMDGGTTLRPAAAECGVSLKTSFYLRHRLMAVIEADTTGQLSGISEMDETFFRESHKGQRDLGENARKRGGRSRRKKKSAEKTEEKTKAVRKIPVMVACDRQDHVTDAVLEHVSNDKLFTQLSGRILPGSTLCTDAHLSHEKLADQLKVTLKELVTTAGEYVREKVYHIQTVNAYHSELKRWINGFFKGVATKYLPRYLGWKRFLKTHMFSEENLLDQEASHWLNPHLL